MSQPVEERLTALEGDMIKNMKHIMTLQDNILKHNQDRIDEINKQLKAVVTHE